MLQPADLRFKPLVLVSLALKLFMGSLALKRVQLIVFLSEKAGLESDVLVHQMQEPIINSQIFLENVDSGLKVPHFEL